MKTRNMVLSALFAALLCICAWISLPLGAMHFTLQTFGIFLALLICGGKWGSLSILVYIALGAMGLPVFSGFQGGPGVLLGPTGGYLLGFLLLALCYWLLQKKLGQLPALLLGLLLCYGCGTAWFYWMYGGSLWAVLMNCVIPYLIPDGIKLLLAVTVRKRLRL